MDRGITYVLFLAGAQGLLLSLALVFSGFKKRPANSYLGIILGVCSIELLNAWAMSFNYHSQKNNFPFWLFGSYLLIPASLLLFIKYTTGFAFTFHRKYLLLFIPALIEILAEFASFYRNRFTGTHIRLSAYRAWEIYTEALPVVLMLAVLIYYYLQLKKSSKARKLPGNRLFRLKHYGFLVAFSSLALLWIAETLIQLPVYPVTEFLLCCFLFVMGYLVYFQPDFYKNMASNNGKKTDHPFGAYDEAKEIARIRQVFEVQKVYRQPRLTLEDLAKQLNLPGRFVSLLINNYYQANFSQVLNTYRVNEVLERKQDPGEANKTLLGIALDSGFNSKSSFNNIFKTFTGETPSAYLSKQKIAPKS